MRKVAASLLLTALFLFTVVILIQPKSFAQSRQLLIYQIGDSITEIGNGYRCPLWTLMTHDGFNVRNIGTRRDTDVRTCTNANFPMHGGISFISAAGYDSGFQGYLNQIEMPDVALIHLGTNDTWNGGGEPVTKIAGYIQSMITKLRTKNPNVTVIVAKIIGSTNGAMTTKITQYNAELAKLTALSTTQSRVLIADLFTGFNPSTDTYDGYHPTAGGGQKMANAWYAVLKPELARLSGQVVPTGAPTNQPTTTIVPTGSNGQRWWLHGVNYAWLNYGGDFGNAGAGVATNKTTHDTKFADMKAKGVKVVRWWLFPNGSTRSSPQFGQAPGSQVYTDIDAALSLAQKHDIYLVFTMIDGTANAQDTNYLVNATNRTNLVNNTFTPILQRYGNNPYILAWDAINEPNWMMESNNSLIAPVQDYVKKFATAVHTHTNQKVYVGLGYAKHKDWMKGLGLDFYAFHYYSWMSPYAEFDIFKHPASYWGMDKPIVIGEMDATVSNHYETLYSLGYSGAWGWSYNYNSTGDKLQVNWPLFTGLSTKYGSQWINPPTGNQGTVATGVPTSIPTGSITGTRVDLTIFMHGIGKGGDNVNTQSTGTTNPLHPQRTLTLELFNASNQAAGTFQGTVTFNATNGNFTGTVGLGSTPGGVYTARIKSPQYLKRSVPGILNVQSGQATAVSALSLVTGDVNNDNVLSILDYNMILDCFSDLTPARNCSDAAKKLATDITDDGNVNQFDYNLFLRELSVQAGG